jgi:hypothetical protein
VPVRGSGLEVHDPDAGRLRQLFRQDGAVATPVVFLEAQERDALRGGQFAQRFEFQNRLRLLEMLGENSGISPIRSGPLHAPPSASPARGGEGN